MRQALRIEANVVFEDRIERLLGVVEAAEDQFAERALERRRGGVVARIDAFAQRHVLFDPAAETRGLRARILVGAVVRQVESLRVEREQAGERRLERRRVELRRRRRRDQAAGEAFHRRIAETQGIAGEDTAAGRVVNAEMMTRVAGRVDEQQLALTELAVLAIVDDLDPLFVDRLDGAVEAAKRGLAVNRDGARDEPRRVDHVARAARMDQQRRLVEAPHHRAGAAGMVEVHVGRDYVSDLLRFDVEFGERRRDVGKRVGRAGLDQRGFAVGDEQVNRRDLRFDVAGVDAVDAVGDGGVIRHLRRATSAARR